VNITSPNRHICEVVVELGEDVGFRAGGQIDSAERSLAGMVASLCIAAGAQCQPTARHSLQVPMAAVYATQPSCAVEP
jgi:hypothetical protein